MTDYDREEQIERLEQRVADIEEDIRRLVFILERRVVDPCLGADLSGLNPQGRRIVSEARALHNNVKKRKNKKC